MKPRFFNAFMRQLATLLLVAGAGLAVAQPSTVGAPKPKDARTDCPALRLQVLPYPGLYEAAVPGRSAQGFDVEIAQALGEQLGCPIQILEVTAPRLWPAMMAGLAELSASTLYTEERGRDAHFLWLLKSRLMVVMHRDVAQRVSTMDEFTQNPSLMLGVIRGGKRSPLATKWVDQLRALGRVQEAGSMPQLLRAYEARRVDAVISNAGALGHASAAWRSQQAIRDWLEGDAFFAGWTMSRRHLPVVWQQRILAAAEQLRKAGVVERSYDRWMPSPFGQGNEVLPASILNTEATPRQ